MIRLTDRDARLLATCARSQWLTTGQIQKLFFRDVTVDRARKRLRKLLEEDYLHSSQPHRMVEMLHAVGPEGKRFLEGKGIEVNLARKLPEHLEHLVGINDIRTELESGRERVLYFFAHWELGKFDWPYRVIPDAVFSIVLDHEATFMVEFDRGTEDRKELLQKLRQYELIPAAFPFDAVLVIADSAQASNRLCWHLCTPKRSFRVLVGDLVELKSQGVFGCMFCDESRKFSLAEVLAGSRDDH
jgi:Replication-relaxation